MSKNKLITPEGTKDYLFEEAILRDKVQNSLRRVFTLRGYYEVVTPGIEFLDVFGGTVSAIPLEKMYKMTDAKGRLLAMRPDSTMPIARLCSTRLKNRPLPLRLYYNQPVYIVSQSLKGRSDERMQAGVELIGASADKSDLEILVTAEKSLEALGFSNYRIELGHVGVFTSLVNALSVDDQTKENVRQLIENKNYPALNDLLDEIDQPEITKVIKLLPRMFGGKEVFDKARACITDTTTLTVIEYLEKLYSSLEALVSADKIAVDLGIVNRAEYYTGIVFKGYVEGYGEEVLSGGRYDSLLHEFGESHPSIGFAVDVDASVSAILRTTDICEETVDVLVFAQSGKEVDAMRYIDCLAKEGVHSEYAVCETEKDALDYAKAKGIARVDIIEDSVRKVDIGGAV